VAAAISAIPNARALWLTGDHDLQAQHPDEVADALHDAAINGFFP
jgi:hypothetical protein